ncbi:phosphoserine phosphatase [Cutibacterium acnes JCM 18916]|nr:phosphoserine phosphatase [Cutibacterium acnes JCM 18916]
MVGELDFTQSLYARVRCLEGLHIGALEEAWKATVITPGTAELVAAAHDVGAAVGLVSGGFTAIVDPLAEQIRLISQRPMSSRSSIITSPDEWLVTSSTGLQRQPGYVAGPRNVGSLLSEQSP